MAMAMPLASRAPPPMNASWPVVVVGAGVAGSFVAARLAHAGVRVLLVEKSSFPRPKVCGACLSGRALAVLDQSGIPAMAGLPKKLGMIPLDRFRLGTTAGEATVALGAGGALSRIAFDAALAEEARRCGATVWEGTEAVAVEDGAGFKRLRLQAPDGSRDVGARLVVIADGLGGKLSGRLLPGSVARNSRIGAGCVLGPDHAGSYAPGIIHMACGAGGYLGLVRQEDGSLDLAMAADRPAILAAGGPGVLAEQWLESCRWPVPPGLGRAAWRGTPPLTRKRVAGVPGIVAVGDAAGYLEPFTGEGMGWALEGAESLSRIVLSEMSRGNPGAAHVRWAREHARVSRRRHAACRIMAGALRIRGLPALAVRLLRWFPGAAWPVTWLLDRQSVPRRSP